MFLVPFYGIVIWTKSASCFKGLIICPSFLERCSWVGSLIIHYLRKSQSMITFDLRIWNKMKSMFVCLFCFLIAHFPVYGIWIITSWIFVVSISRNNMTWLQLFYCKNLSNNTVIPSIFALYNLIYILCQMHKENWVPV